MNLLVVNTKGGVGKSFVATQILPLALNSSNINIFELDNNNKTTLKSNLINFKNLNTHDLDEILFDVSFADEVVNIIDAGGGDDTIEVITALSKNDVEIDTFVIPVLKDFEVTKNLKDTMLRQNRSYPSKDELSRLKSFSKFFIAQKDDTVQGCAVLPFNKNGAYYLYGGSIIKHIQEV